jgi:hypothetical protein
MLLSGKIRRSTIALRRMSDHRKMRECILAMMSSPWRSAHILSGTVRTFACRWSTSAAEITMDSSVQGLPAAISFCLGL